MKTLLRSLPVLILVLALSIPAIGKNVGALYEKAGGFSYDPPKGWNVREFPGMKFRISHAAAEGGFASNINVVDEKFAGGLSTYADANVVNLKKFFQKFTLLSRKDFLTDGKVKGIQIVTTNEQQGRMLRQIFYIFARDNIKYVVTCTALASKGDALDATFEKSMKSFRFHDVKKNEVVAPPAPPSKTDAPSKPAAP